jgi:hypothetical protein
MFQHEEKLSLTPLLEDPSVDGGDAQGSVTRYPELAQYDQASPSGNRDHRARSMAASGHFVSKAVVPLS